MTHVKQHGGWATQARRRGEEYRMCNTCGGRSHRPIYQAEPNWYRTTARQQILNVVGCAAQALGMVLVSLVLWALIFGLFTVAT